MFLFEKLIYLRMFTQIIQKKIANFLLPQSSQVQVKQPVLLEGKYAISAIAVSLLGEPAFIRKVLEHQRVPELEGGVREHEALVPRVPAPQTMVAAILLVEMDSY